jgi:capsular exopolysaccharide synthesis family protein
VTPFPAATDKHWWNPDALDAHLVSLVDPTSFAASQYRKLRYAVERTHETMKLIAVTSAGVGDGKTTTAINLAGALAHAPEVRILIGDLDLLTPSLGGRLGLRAGNAGFADLLLDSNLALDDVVRRHPRFPLSVLPAGRSLPVAYEVLKSARLRELLHEASQRYDYVVLDSPPLLPVPDSQLIADCVDGLVLVVTADRTPRKLLEETLNLLDPSKLIGIVFNGEDQPRSTYYRYYSGYNSASRRQEAGTS